MSTGTGAGAGAGAAHGRATASATTNHVGATVDERTTATILLVEDDDDLRSTLALNLERSGYTVVQAADGQQALDLAPTARPNLVVLDLMLPRVDGREVCRRLRAQSADLPILMLTALDREIDVVNGLDAGADDYMSKPFSLREFLARVKALLRRTDTARLRESVLTAGDLAIFIKEHRAVFHARELHLPLKEFRLLTALVRRRGEVCTRAELLDMVWGADVVVDPRNVDVHIRWLRERLEGDPDGSRLIQTVHGVGYRFAG